jgi:hypothetical protein
LKRNDSDSGIRHLPSNHSLASYESDEDDKKARKKEPSTPPPEYNKPPPTNYSPLPPIKPKEDAHPSPAPPPPPPEPGRQESTTNLIATAPTPGVSSKK